MKRVAYLSVLVFSVTSPVAGQHSATSVKLSASGRVTNDAGAPIPSVDITLVGQPIGALTDARGHYSFAIPPDGVSGAEIRIIARRIGYRSDLAQVRLVDGHLTHDFVLDEQPSQTTRLVRPDSARPIRHLSAPNDIAALASLPSLALGPHRQGEREIRIWTGIAIGYPDVFYRIVERGDTTTGASYRYVEWRDALDRKSRRPISDKMKRDMCEAVLSSRTVFVCRARETSQINWPGAWRALERLDVWNIPDQPLSDYPYAPVLDGDWIAVELWDGFNYRAWDYGNP
ncbi:MAG: carboxypeptidase-like regulatory domain-containing protein, partial [Gemmatimonadaceae bacterium]